ncbi:unnamed protein product, partial [Urochloa humidicola]
WRRPPPSACFPPRGNLHRVAFQHAPATNPRLASLFFPRDCGGHHPVPLRHGDVSCFAAAASLSLPSSDEGP